MEKNSNKKNIIIFAIGAIVIIIGAVFYFTAAKYKTANAPKETTNGADLLASPSEQVHNLAERLPDANPYDAKTNPFEEAKINPFKDVYKNPFSR